MTVIVCDYSKPSLTRKKARSLISALLWKIGPGVYFGSLPLRVADQLKAELKKFGSKSLNIIFCISSSNSPTGFKFTKIGSKKHNEGLSIFENVKVSVDLKSLKNTKRIKRLKASGN